MDMRGQALLLAIALAAPIHGASAQAGVTLRLGYSVSGTSGMPPGGFGGMVAAMSAPTGVRFGLEFGYTSLGTQTITHPSATPGNTESQYRESTMLSAGPTLLLPLWNSNRAMVVSLGLGVYSLMQSERTTIYDNMGFPVDAFLTGDLADQFGYGGSIGLMLPVARVSSHASLSVAARTDVMYTTESGNMAFGQLPEHFWSPVFSFTANFHWSAASIR